MPTVATPTAGRATGLLSMGALRPGGLRSIVGNTQAAASVVSTVLAHNLVSTDIVNFASTNSNPNIDGLRVVTRLTDTTFSVPVNVNVAPGTAGTFQPVIIATSVANPTVVTCGSVHGLRTGDTITVTGSNGTPNVDGAAQVVTVLSDRTFSLPVNVTIAGTAGIFTKVTYNSDALDRGAASGGGAIVITSTIGTAPRTATVDIQGSVDGINWFNIPYALPATPRTWVATALTITTATTGTYFLRGGEPWRYLRLAVTSCTNVGLQVAVATSDEGEGASDTQPGLSGSVVQKVTTLTNAGTAYPVPAAALAGRSALLVQASPTNSVYVYIGGASVTADTAATGGIILAPGQSVPISLGATVVLYAVSTVAGQLVRTMEVA